MSENKSLEIDVKALHEQRAMREALSDEAADLFEGLDGQIVEAVSGFLGSIEKGLELNLQKAERYRTAHIKEIAAIEPQVMLLLQKLKELSALKGQPQTTGTKKSFVKPHSSQLSIVRTVNIKIPKIPKPPLIMWTPKDVLLLGATLIESCDWVFSNFFMPTCDVETLKEPQHVVGSKGDALGCMNQPVGLAIHPTDGRVFVADRMNGRIQVFSPSLTPLYCFSPLHGSSRDKFTPWGLEITQNGQHIYALSTADRCLHKFTCEGEHVKGLYIDDLVAHKIANVQNFTLGSDDSIYLPDYGESFIYKMTDEWTVLQRFDLRTPKLQGPFKPFSLIMTNDAQLLVLADSGKEVLSLLDSGDITEIVGIRRVGDSSQMCRGPENGFVVSDRENGKVMFYNKKGQYVHEIRVSDARGIGFGPNNHFYVVSKAASQVYCFVPK